MKAGTLEVLLIGGNDLKSSDFFDKSDPYTIIKCQGCSFQSTTAKEQGSNPQWNQTFVFLLKDDHEGVDELFMKVYDKDHVVGSDDFIGTVRVPLAEVFNKKQHEGSYDVILPGGKAKGKIKLSMRFTPS